MRRPLKLEVQGSKLGGSTPLYFSLKSPADFVPVAPRVAFSGMRQAKIENNLFIIYLCMPYVPIPDPRLLVVLVMTSSVYICCASSVMCVTS